MNKSYAILVPVYNEAKTIYAVLQKVWSTEVPSGWSRKLWVIDDGSIDQSKEEIHRFQKNFESPDIHVILQQNNQGKGSVIQEAIASVKTDFLLIHDADLEYDPADHKSLLAQVNHSNAVVYGSRFLGKQKEQTQSLMSFWQYLGNRVLTRLTNVMTGTKLTDMETCLKLLPVPMLQKLDIRARGFSIEPELTIKVHKAGASIKEVPVSYIPRTSSKGKKIRPWDGFMAIWVIFKYSLSNG